MNHLAPQPKKNSQCLFPVKESLRKPGLDVSSFIQIFKDIQAIPASYLIEYMSNSTDLFTFWEHRWGFPLNSTQAYSTVSNAFDSDGERASFLFVCEATSGEKKYKKIKTNHPLRTILVEFVLALFRKTHADPHFFLSNLIVKSDAA